MTYCKNCVWEFDYRRCPNDYKHQMHKDKKGRLKVQYCMWFMRK